MHRFALLALLPLTLTSPALAQGKIIAIGDEWLLSDEAFSTQPVQSTRLALNIAGIFANNQPGSFLVLSDIQDVSGLGPRGVQGPALAATMTSAGHSWTIDPALPVTLPNLMPYDGVFLAGGIGSGAANAAVLTNYVNNGGSVLIMVGVGSDPSYPCGGGAACEAALWDPLLGEFGLQFGNSYFAVRGTLLSIPVTPSPSLLTVGLNNVTWGNGQLAIDLEPANPLNRVAIRGDFSAFGGGPQGPVNDIIATYNVPGEIGTSLCTGNPNSTGEPGTLTITGIPVATQSSLLLRAENLPPGQFGYFLVSQTQGMFMPAGSQGILCLSGNIGRFNSAMQVIQGPTGSIQVELTAIPVTPIQAVLPGDTWNFQCWYRDANPGSTSNFTDAASVTFQ